MDGFRFAMLVVIVLGAVGYAIVRRGELKRILERVARELNDIKYLSAHTLEGIKDGRKVKVWFENHEGRLEIEDFTGPIVDELGGRTVYSGRPRRLTWTLVECELPARELVLRVRRQFGSTQGMVDVEVGDEPFDRRWVVEGAPADVVRHVLDEPTRKRLDALAPHALEQPEPNVLRLRAQLARESPWIVDAVTLLVSIANGIDRAYDEADREAMARAEPTGSPYRGEVRTIDVEAERARELERLRRVRAPAGGFGVAIVIFFVTAALVIVALVRR